MKSSLRLILPALVLAAAPLAASAADISVYTSVAPNAFGSPSYDAYVANAIAALRTGVSSYGDSSLPSYYEQTSSVRANEVIVTGFPSWKGQADPGSVFGAAFANELGNRMLFGLVIDGAGSQFSISNLSFTAVSSDAGNALGFGFGAGAYNYSNQYVGLLKGDDGVLFTSDDVLVTGGANTQLVDGLVGRGSGSSFAAYCSPCTVGEQQAAIDEAAAFLTGPTTFTGTYSLGADSGSGTFNIAAVPEPGAWALMIAGFGLAGATLRRRRAALA